MYWRRQRRLSNVVCTTWLVILRLSFAATTRGDQRQSLIINSSKFSVGNLAEELPNRHIPGGELMRSIANWRDCVRTCVSQCTAADFDNTDLTCWHHFGQPACTQPTSFHLGVNHYRTVACRPDKHIVKVPEGFIQAFNSRQLAVGPPQLPPAPPQPLPPLPPSPPPQPPPPSCGRPVFSPLTGRIVGGDESRPRSWPWQVALRNKNARSSRCAGSLIAPQWVLTTAHCVDQDLVPNNWLILSGAHDLLALESGRVAHSVAEILIHEKFNLDTFDNDIALIKLGSAVTWGAAVSPVCLPPPEYEFLSGSQCLIVGWGVATNGRRPLKQAGIPIVPTDTCRRADWLGSEFTLTDRMICAGYEHGGVDTCQGDSGGPLVCFVNNHWVQAGVTSFGRGCGLPQKPGVYTKVSKFIGWIQNVINRHL